MKVIKIKRVKKGTIKPIKPFKTLEEEANFWDTHSALDEIDEGTVVGFHQAKKTNTITLRIDQKSLQKLRERAFYKGIGPTTLARMWIMEKLRSVPRKSKPTNESSQAILHKIKKPKKLWKL